MVKDHLKVQNGSVHVCMLNPLSTQIYPRKLAVDKQILIALLSNISRSVCVTVCVFDSSPNFISNLFLTWITNFIKNIFNIKEKIQRILHPTLACITTFTRIINQQIFSNTQYIVL